MILKINLLVRVLNLGLLCLQSKNYALFLQLERKIKD